MKKLSSDFLKNVVFSIYSLNAFLLFLFLHKYSETICTQNRGVINGIADGAVLAILLSLINLIISVADSTFISRRIAENS